VIIDGAISNPYAGRYDLGLHVTSFDSGREGRVNEFYKRSHEKNTKAGATLFGYSHNRVRGFISATRMLYFTFSLPAALVCPFSSLALLRCFYIVYPPPPPLLLVCRRRPHSPVYLHCLGSIYQYSGRCAPASLSVPPYSVATTSTASSDWLKQ
jgi:hypothetical protein